MLIRRRAKMKAEQDIEKQLANSQNAWDSQPTPDLWDRLETRLDEAIPAIEPRKPKNWPFRLGSVALLIGLGLGLWWAWPTGDAVVPLAKPLATHSAFPTSLEIETEDTNFAENQNSQLSFGDNVGIGGTALSKTRPSPIKGKSGSFFAEFRRQHLGLQGATERHFGSDGDPLAGSNPGGQASYNGSSIQSNGEMTNTNLTMSNMYAGRPELEVTANLLPLGNMLVTNSVGNPIDTVSSLEQYSSLIRSADNNRYLQINAARNDMNFNLASPTSEGNQQNLQHLKWLLGSWKTQGTSGGTIEEWRQLDDFTLVGRGYFVVNGDTMVTQEMRIEQRGPNVYYIIAKDENAKAMKFRLRSRLNNELIFQDESPKTNRELLLRNNPSTNEVEKIITTPEERSQNLQKSNGPQAPSSRKVMQRKQHP